MPQLGETVTEGTITKWLKKVGDKIAIDEVLFEVSTDKVDSEVPSTATGYLTEIVAQEGDTVLVGATLARVSESLDSVSQSAPEPAPSFTPPAPPQSAPEPAPEPAPSFTPPAPPQSAPATVNSGTIADEAVSHSLSYAVDSLVLSPVVRRLIDENRIDPTEIAGSGAGSRITRSDVLDYLDRRAQGEGGAVLQTAPSFTPPAPPQSAPEPAPSFTPPVQTAPPSPVLQPTVRAEGYAPATPSARDEVIPFSNIRRRTAEHMVRSRATSAHTLVAIEVDYEPVERVRHLLKESFAREEGFSLTYLPFIARATVEAIRTFPRINASVGDDALIVHRDLNLAIAVDLDLDGLIAPVIREADQMRLKGLARTIRDLATRARSKRLNADELAGGTFTITNPGPYGTFITAPIINQPQVAILSTDGIKRKAVVIALPDGSESIAIHSVGILALSFDHRVIDGAYAAAFLARMKEIIETWNWAQEF